MRIITFILFLFFSLGILGKANVIIFIKKSTSTLEIASISDIDKDSKSCDDDNNEEKESEEIEDKNVHTPCGTFSIKQHSNFTKHALNFFQLQFKSSIKEVATPPPQFI